MSWFLRPDKWPITPQDWLKVVDDLARAPTRVLLETFASVADALVGKEVELRSAKGTVTVNVDSVVGTHSAPPVALGAWRPGLDLEGLEEVDIVVHDVRWDGGRIDRLTIRAQNVNLEGGVVSSVVAGPIDLAGEVDQATLDELLERYEAPVQVILDGTDRATVHQGGRLTADGLSRARRRRGHLPDPRGALGGHPAAVRPPLPDHPPGHGPAAPPRGCG